MVMLRLMNELDQLRQYNHLQLVIAISMQVATGSRQ